LVCAVAVPVRCRRAESKMRGAKQFSVRPWRSDGWLSEVGQDGLLTVTREEVRATRKIFEGNAEGLGLDQ
jgi:hypothetical protein